MHRTESIYAVPVLPRYEGEEDKDKKPVFDLEDPKVKEAFDVLVKEREAGLKANRDTILEEKRTLQTQLDELNQRWEGLDAEAIRGLMKQVEGNEDAKLVAEGKIDEVIERRTERLRLQATKDVEAAQALTTELEAKLVSRDVTIRELVVDASIREAAGKIEGFVPGAVGDAITRGRMVFSVDDDRNPVALDKEESVVRGSDGKTPLQPEEWLRGLVAGDCRHWLGASGGGGAAGGGQPGEGPGKDAVDQMSPRAKLEVGLKAQSEA